MLDVTFTFDQRTDALKDLIDTFSCMEQGKIYRVEMKEIKRLRSLNANNYSWLLTDKLSEKMLLSGARISKDEMHALMIFRYGQPLLENGMPVIISVKSEIDLKSASEIFQYAQPIGFGYVNGVEFTHYRIYRGSHTYNKDEMKIFIDGIVEECRELGIDTRTPDEIENLISLMKEER